MAYVVMVFAATEEDVQEVYKLHHPSSTTGKPKTVGIYRLPSKHDDSCNGYCQGGKSKKLNGWGRDPEEGFIVHQCGRPHQDRRTRMRNTLLDILGINFMKRSVTPALFQNPLGWGD